MTTNYLIVGSKTNGKEILDLHAMFSSVNTGSQSGIFSIKFLAATAHAGQSSISFEILSKDTFPSASTLHLTTTFPLISS